MRKEEILRAIQDLTDDAPLDDAIKRLNLLHKIECGIERRPSHDHDPAVR